MALCKQAASIAARSSRFREAWPNLSLSARERSRGLNPPPPVVGAAPSADFGRPSVTHQRRWWWGGSPDQGEPVGGSRVEGGSPQRCPHGGGAQPVGKRRC
jgi:hypothetical protein